MVTRFYCTEGEGRKQPSNPEEFHYYKGLSQSPFYRNLLIAKMLLARLE